MFEAAETENLSRTGALLRIPLSELGLPANASLTHVAQETTSVLGDLASLELHYEILGTLVRRMARPVRLGRGAEGQAYVEVGCALNRSLTESEVEFLGLPLPPLQDAPPAEDTPEEDLDPASKSTRRRVALESPLALVVCANANQEAPPFAVGAETVDRLGAHVVAQHLSELPFLPERPGVSGLLSAMTKAYGHEPWVVLMREGAPVWSGTAHLETVELGPKTGRVDMQLSFSRALTVSEQARLRLR